MEKGRVKWVDQVRGFGVIGQRKGTDVLFYCRSIGLEKCKRLRGGDDVKFEASPEGKMVQAVNIRKIK
jgi:cold shock CspA family protein